MNSYFAGTNYENSTNPNVGYNLDSASNLLAEAGWKEKDKDGYLIKKGKKFEVDLPFQKGMDRYLVIYKEDLEKIGIKINLKEIDIATSVKIGNEKNFILLPVSWIALNVPNPEGNYSSKMADIKGNSNWSGIRDIRIDELIEKYNLEFDKDKRVEIIKQIDSLLAENACYILLWYGPFHRLAFHNLFKYPKCLLDREAGIESVLRLT